MDPHSIIAPFTPAPNLNENEAAPRHSVTAEGGPHALWRLAALGKQIYLFIYW